MNFLRSQGPFSSECSFFQFRENVFLSTVASMALLNSIKTEMGFHLFNKISLHGRTAKEPPLICMGGCCSFCYHSSSQCFSKEI